jgi:hypothetical protein
MNSTRKELSWRGLGAGALLIACLALIWSGGDEAGRESLQRPVLNATAPANGSANLPVAASNAPEPDGNREAVAHVATHVGTKDQPADTVVAPFYEPRILTGVIHLTDRDGFEVVEPDGVLRILISNASGSTEMDLPIHHGEWKADLDLVPGHTSFQLIHLEVGSERRAVITPLGRSGIPDSLHLDVYAGTPRPLTLHVVDEQDGRELDHVAVCYEYQPSFGIQWDPEGVATGSYVVDGSLQSPIDLAPLLPLIDLDLYDQGIVTIRVTARCYTWDTIRFDTKVGGDGTVRLKRAGSLEVAIVADGQRERGLLTVDGFDGLDSHHQKEIRLQSQTLLLHGVAPGLHDVNVSIDGPSREGHLIGTAQAHILEGSTSQVTVLLASPRTEGATSVRGLLRAPVGWNLDRPFLSLRLRDDLQAGFQKDHFARQPVREGEGPVDGYNLFSWSFEGLQPGRYRLTNLYPQVSLMLDIPPSGLEGVDLVLPPPAVLRLTIVEDGPDGADRIVNPEDLEWDWATEGSSAFDPGFNFDSITREYVATVPAVPIIVEVADPLYISQRVPLDLSPGIRRETIRMERSQVLRVTLRNADGPVMIPTNLEMIPKPAPGTDGDIRGWAARDYYLEFPMTSPGHYLLGVPKLPGYLPVPVQQIYVAPLKETTHTILLEREPSAPATTTGD